MSPWDKFIAWGSKLLGLKEKPVKDPAKTRSFNSSNNSPGWSSAKESTNTRQPSLDSQTAIRSYAPPTLSYSFKSQTVTSTLQHTHPSAPTRSYSTATTTNQYAPPPTYTHHHHHPVSQPRTQRKSANQYLYHYTDKRGIDGILREMLIRSTTVNDSIHARMGAGVYLTAMGPDHTTDEILINNYNHAARHFRQKTKHYIQLRKSDVTFWKHGRRNLYIIDGYNGLDLLVTPHTFGERDLCTVDTSHVELFQRYS